MDSEKADSDKTSKSLKRFITLKRVKEDSKVSINEVGLGVFNYSLKCYAGPFRHESITLSHAPEGQVFGDLNRENDQ